MLRFMTYATRVGLGILVLVYFALIFGLAIWGTLEAIYYLQNLD